MNAIVAGGSQKPQYFKHYVEYSFKRVFIPSETQPIKNKEALLSSVSDGLLDF